MTGIERYWVMAWKQWVAEHDAVVHIVWPDGRVDRLA
jgi:hypothetical protein